MKQRRIVRPKRAAGALSGSTTTVAGTNPFAGVTLTGASANPFAGVHLAAAAPQTNPFAQVTLANTVSSQSERALRVATANRILCTAIACHSQSQAGCSNAGV